MSARRGAVSAHGTSALPALLAASLLGGLCPLAGCERPPTAGKQNDAGPSAAEPPAGVAAHTTGTVSSESRIRVAFSAPVVEAPGPADPSPITFEPELEGTARWTRTDELEFEPKQPLPRGQRIEATVDLPGLGIAGATPFTFAFVVLRQDAALTLDGVETGTGDARKRAALRGRVVTDDVADPLAVEQGLKVITPEGAPTVTWTHEEDRKDHAFVIEGLPRGDDDYSLTVRFEGSAVGADGQREVQERIPGLNSFTVLQAKAVQDGERHLELRFSDPLKPGQNLEGLITIKGQKGLRYVVRANVLEVFGKARLPDELTVNVSPGIANTAGYKLKQGGEYAIRFERLKPEVRFVGKGSVVPSSEGLTVPIETANLRRLTVEAVRVPGENLPQFFQVNRYDGDSELQRVGRVVWRQRVDLGDARDLKGAWSRHGLDLGPLVAQETSGMIRLRLTFDPSDILYNCEGGPRPEVEIQAVSSADDDLGNWDDAPAESSYWDNWEGNYWEAYENRTDPCHPGYYRKYHDHDVSVSKNVLLTDVGIIAKRGTSGEMLVVVTDLKNARPVGGADVTVLDYQQTEIAKGRTDGKGRVKLSSTRTPFLVVAESRGQSGYLRLEEGAALSAAHFDTGGASVSRGLKGFFYGERGVWRPGDEVFLTFLLSDKDRPLPGSHPVHFTLTDPRNKTVTRLVKKESNDGFYVFKLSTSPDAPTGNYTATVKVGGATFTHVLKVEAIVPNRLKIGLVAKEEVLSPRAPVEAELTAQWLHGATAKNLEAMVEVSLAPTKTSFPKLSEYRFDAPTRTYAGESRALFEGKLDAKGHATLTERIPFSGTAPGMMSARFTTKVFEPSGAFSVDRHQIPFSPYERYLGIRLPPGDKARGMLLTDEKHSVRMVAVDAEGKKVTTPVKVDVKLYKINWRWWWEKGEETLTEYAGRKSFKPLAEDTVTMTGGEGTWDFEIKYPDWGRYLVVATDSEGGHQTGWIFYADWPGWAGRSQKDQPGGATVLTLATDKRAYEVGEEVVLTIPASVQGRALVSLESGSRVVQADWVESRGEAIQYRFRATADMAPNVYAHVTLLQPHLRAKNDLPMRLYGITPIAVVAPKTQLHPTLSVPESFEPGKVAMVKVKERDGRPMTYTLALVDEGLLGLTRFGTPDPWNFFYAREALGVKTWDIYDEVAGAFGGKLESMLAIGGDGEGEESGRQRANRFPPMVLFAGPFSADAGEEKSHQLKLPPYVGAVRVMVVAGHDDAYGNAEASVYVRKPLIVLGTLPRVVGPGESVALPAAVFALDDKIKNVEVSLTTNELLSLEGDATRRLKFDGAGDQIVPFKLKVKDRLGVARVTVTAKGGGHTADYAIELDVRHPGSAVTDVVATTVEPGQSWRADRLALPGLPGTNRVVVEASRVPPIDLEKRLGFLIRYPHGCVEQTTSAAFPQVHLGRLLELNAAQADNVEKHVKAAVEKLRGFQHANGGFAYWPSDQAAHDWSTSYVGHFLLEAQSAGYLVPGDMLASWKRYQRDAANSYRADGTSDLAQAYRLYTLALAGAPEIGAMNRLKESKLSSPGRWRLAAAYQLAGQSSAARALIDEAATDVEPYQELSGTFGSAMRDQAMILETLVLLGDRRAVEVAKDLATALSAERHLSTQETAYGLLAMQRWSTSTGAAGDGLAFRVVYGGRAPVTTTTEKPIAQVPLRLSFDEQGQPEPLVVENTADGVLFLRVIKTGIPPVGQEKAAQNGLSLAVTYKNNDGFPVKLSALEQGADVLVSIEVKNTSPGKTLSELALTHIVPSGFEIRNERLDPRGAQTGKFDYQDVRDDRVLTYFDLKPGEARTFEVATHATYLGRYYLPPIQVEAMYDATIQAREVGQWIEIQEAIVDEP